MRARDVGVREIARRLGRSASTISRELRRNAATRGGTLEYRASTAQWKAERSARRPKPAKLVNNPRLHDYVQQRLSGEITDEDGNVVGSEVESFNGRRHGRRKDRRWASAWSPEQISGRLLIEMGLRLYRLPGYCPHLNLIEGVWRRLKHFLMPRRFYDSKSELREAVLDALRLFGAAEVHC